MTWPTSPPFVAGNILTAAQLNALRADLLAASGFVRKTADESVTSSTVLQNDDHLFYAIPGAGSYVFEFRLFATSAANAAGDMSVGFTFPTGTLSVGGAGPDISIASAGVSTGQWGANAAYTPGTVMQNYGLSTFHLLIKVSGLLVATAAGTLQLQWAQQASSASASTMKAGSHLLVQQVA